MWIRKLSSGVLRVLTPLGPRYFKPSFAQRFYLLWIFRHFQTLPAKVLSRRQIRAIDLICRNRQILTMHSSDLEILGTLEQRLPPTPEDMDGKRPSASVSESIQAIQGKLRQRS